MTLPSPVDQDLKLFEIQQKMVSPRLSAWRTPCIAGWHRIPRYCAGVSLLSVTYAINMFGNPFALSGVSDVSPNSFVASQIPRGELEYWQVRLREYQQALADARSLSESTGGIDLAGKDLAITPEGGIEILQRRVNETQSELDALDDSARRNDIGPGAIRGQ